MSEEKCHIQTSEDGEISATFSPSKIPFEDADACEVEQNGVLSSGIELIGNIHSSGQQVDNNCSIDEVGDVSDNEEADNVTQNKDDGSQYCSNENLQFNEPTSSSTPLMTREASAVSPCVSYKASPIKNRSSATDSCTVLDADGDNDNTSEVSCGCSYHGDRECNHASLVTAQPRQSLMIPGLIRVPIVGHETMEARSKFTVFKIHVMVEDDDVGWFIFRRYSDFVHLNDQLKLLFPSFRFLLPPKRWFRSNFDLDFLEERQQGLQTYVDNVTGHGDICNSKPVRDFFCFDDPPGPHDSLEESRAQCECMEEMVYLLRKELTEKDTEIDLLKEELDLYKNQVQLLSSRLSELNKLNSMDKPRSEKHRASTADEQFDVNPH